MPGPRHVEDARLTPGAWTLVSLAVSIARHAERDEPKAHDWFTALLERHRPMVEAICSTAEVLGRIQERARAAADTGPTYGIEEVVSVALGMAKARKRDAASEWDLAAVIVEAAMNAGNPVETDANTPTAKTDTGQAANAPTGPVIAPTPVLDRFGRNLTKEASEGHLEAIQGREEEVELALEVLCRRTKRNPVFVGPAGVGKTALAEALAQRIAAGSVPERLKGNRLIAIQVTSLIAGAGYKGDLESRVQALLAEASSGGIILFIDEVHSVVGAGGREGVSDLATMLKPALARGDFACIAATTDHEFRRFIESDAALERRFQPIRVQELTAEQTLVVLKGLRDKIQVAQGITVPDPVLGQMIDFAARQLRNRCFPDKAIDLLEQGVAYAHKQGSTLLSVEMALQVASRLAGAPRGLPERLRRLQACTVNEGLLSANEAATLIARLQVTARGLDIRPNRPNAILLVTGNALVSEGLLAQTIARELYGAEDRIVSIDLGSFQEPSDISRLVGSGPGYVGYGESLPIHRVIQTPWCVLRLTNIDACHPSIRETVTQALLDGYFTDGKGRRIHLSDTLTLLTAQGSLDRTGPVGFQPDGSSDTLSSNRVPLELGPQLGTLVDLTIDERPERQSADPVNEKTAALEALALRYRAIGIDLAWQPSFMSWLDELPAPVNGHENWAEMLDNEVNPHIAQFVDEAGLRQSLTIAHNEGAIDVRAKQDHT